MVELPAYFQLVLEEHIDAMTEAVISDIDD
jgi:hypothetical protein